MNYIFECLTSLAYWKHFSLKDIGVEFLKWNGIISLFTIFGVESIDKFIKSNSMLSIVLVILLSLILSFWNRFPKKKISYKLPALETHINVTIGNIFNVFGQKVISTNTLFETRTEGDVIAKGSLQGQFHLKYYENNLQKLDRKLEEALVDVTNYTEIPNHNGKIKKYPIGTIAQIKESNSWFYWLAMADLNEHNTADTTVENIKMSLDALWKHLKDQGQKEPLIIPVLGLGRGRLLVSTKEMIGIISKSFYDGIKKHGSFVDSLTIVIAEEKASNFQISLRDISDYLHHIL